MESLTSADGTRIAYTAQGTGATVILVGGGLDDGAENSPLTDVLSDRFTVVNYARRGRPPSGDTLPYAVEREIEDLAALVDAVGSPQCHLYGVSSGGALVLEAAVRGLPVDRLGVYEVPYQVDAASVAIWKTYLENLENLAAASRPGEMIELFMRLAGSSEEEIAGARESPAWSQLEPIAHTLAYDAACLGDGPPPERTLANVRQPTLVATGAVRDPHMSTLQPGFFDAAADRIAELLPRAERAVFEGQSHIADPHVVASALAEFLDGP